jgi:hypothetical protein
MDMMQMVYGEEYVNYTLFSMHCRIKPFIFPGLCQGQGGKYGPGHRIFD